MDILQISILINTKTKKPREKTKTQKKRKKQRFQNLWGPGPSRPAQACPGLPGSLEPKEPYRIDALQVSALIIAKTKKAGEKPKKEKNKINKGSRTYWAPAWAHLYARLFFLVFSEQN